MNMTSEERHRIADCRIAVCLSFSKP